MEKEYRIVATNIGSREDINGFFQMLKKFGVGVVFPPPFFDGTVVFSVPSEESLNHWINVMSGQVVIGKRPIYFFGKTVDRTHQQKKAVTTLRVFRNSTKSMQRSPFLDVQACVTSDQPVPQKSGWFTLEIQRHNGKTKKKKMFLFRHLSGEFVKELVYWWKDVPKRSRAIKRAQKIREFVLHSQALRFHQKRMLKTWAQRSRKRTQSRAGLQNTALLLENWMQKITIQRGFREWAHIARQKHDQKQRVLWDKKCCLNFKKAASFRAKKTDLLLFRFFRTWRFKTRCRRLEAHIRQKNNFVQSCIQSKNSLEAMNAEKAPLQRQTTNRRALNSKKKQYQTRARKNEAVEILKKFFGIWKSKKSRDKHQKTQQMIPLVSKDCNFQIYDLSNKNESFSADASKIFAGIIRIRFLSHVHLQLLGTQEGLIKELCKVFLKNSSNCPEIREVNQLNCVAIFSKIVSGFCRVISVGNKVSKKKQAFSNYDALQTKIMCTMVEEAVHVLDHLKPFYSKVFLIPSSQNSKRKKIMSSREGRKLIILCLNIYSQNSDLLSKPEVYTNFREDLRSVWKSFLEGVVKQSFSSFSEKNKFFEVLVEKTLGTTKIF